MDLRPPHPARDVFLALALKGMLLLAIYLMCFAPAQRPPSDAAATAAALVGTSAKAVE